VYIYWSNADGCTFTGNGEDFNNVVTTAPLHYVELVVNVSCGAMVREKTIVIDRGIYLLFFVFLILSFLEPRFAYYTNQDRERTGGLVTAGDEFSLTTILERNQV